MSTQRYDLKVAHFLSERPICAVGVIDYCGVTLAAVGRARTLLSCVTARPVPRNRVVRAKARCLIATGHRTANSTHWGQNAQKWLLIAALLTEQRRSVTTLLTPLRTHIWLWRGEPTKRSQSQTTPLKTYTWAGHRDVLTCSRIHYSYKRGTSPALASDVWDEQPRHAEDRTGPENGSWPPW